MQSQRTDIYRKYVEELDNTAYYCFCTKDRLDNLRMTQKFKVKFQKYDGLCRGISKEEAKVRSKGEWRRMCD